MKLKSKSPLLMKNNSTSVLNKTIFGYTVVFAVFAAVVFWLYFFSNDRSLILVPDGLSQHAVILGYYGEYLRTIIKNIFVEHTFVIPMFDFSIGLGNDIVSTLHYYAIGDPLNLLSVFVPVEYTEYLYSFLVILRMYLSGFSFSLYMLHRNSHPSAIVTGAFAYAFSGFCMRATEHPFFITGLIYCPLIFLGIDLILQKKKPLLYIVSMALILMSNFYFAYMTCIIMLVYAALRYFTVNKKGGFKLFAQTVGKFAIYTINGFLISMIIFLPQVVNVLSTDRLNVKNTVDLIYEPNYYASFFDALTNPSVGNYWIAIGFTGISLLSLFVCFLRAKKHKNIVISFCLAVVAACIPVCGHIFNGFAYVVNRWVWIITFIASVALTVAYDELFELNDKEKKVLWCIAVGYIGIVCCIVSARSEISLLMLVILFAVLCLATISGTVGINKTTAKRIVSVLLVLSVFMQFTYRYDYREGNKAVSNVKLGEFYENAYSNTVAALVNNVDDDSAFYRYDDNNSAINENVSLLGNTNSTSFYYSIANSNVSKFIQEIGLNYPMEQRFLNFDHRYILQMLAGCKYVSDSVSMSKFLLFSKVDETLTAQHQIALNVGQKSVGYYKGYYTHGSSDQSTFKLSELKYALPMGYTYDSIMSRGEYEKLSPVEKQNVLLQTAVIDGVYNNIDSAEIRTDGVKQIDIFEQIKNSAKITEGIEINGNRIVVNDSSAQIQIEVLAPAYSECYMSVDGISYEDISPYDGLRNDMQEAVEKQQEIFDEEALVNGIQADIADVDPISIKQLNRAELLYNPTTSVNVSVSSSLLGKKESLTYYTPKNKFYSGADTFMVNIGCSLFAENEENTEEKDTLTISFSHPGIYTIEDWSVCYQSLNYVGDDYRARTENVLENVEITNNENTVRGTISLDEAKILATQIPYSEGWTVTVDGEEAELLNVNTMFCGVLLEPGEHTVEFDYVTPNANIAVILTVIGSLQLIVTAILWNRKKKKESSFAVESEETAD